MDHHRDTAMTRSEEELAVETTRDAHPGFPYAER
jgi:hypothetical protein